MRFSRSAHLTALIADSERLAGRLAAATIPEAEVARAREQDLLASLHLDGSTIPGASGWKGAIRTRAEEDAELAAADREVWTAERDGLGAALDDVGFAEALRCDPPTALADVHARITNGLLAEDRRGRWRTDERAVTDASVGRIIYWPTKPAEIGIAVAELTAWLQGPGSREHALVRSGWLLLHVLRIQPFDAANGRVGRVAARALLADGGLDPYGITPFDRVQAGDAIGLFDEVARTVRRRDATVWLERWGEIVTAALRQALRTHGPDRPDDSPAATVLDGLPDRFTITDWREHAGPTADDQLRELLDAGMVDRVLGARGLRFERAE